LHVEPVPAGLAAGALAAAPALALAGVDGSPPPQEASTAQSEADAAMRPRHEEEYFRVIAQE
jgi:hypothetical protein